MLEYAHLNPQKIYRHYSNFSRRDTNVIRNTKNTGRVKFVIKTRYTNRNKSKLERKVITHTIVEEKILNIYRIIANNK